MPAVIVNSWKASSLRPDRSSDRAGSPLLHLQDTADKVVEEQYNATADILNEFREYFPSVMSPEEYVEQLLGEDLAIEQPPSATEFVEQILAERSSSEEEETEEGETIFEEAYERGFNVVEKFVNQNSEAFGPKIVGNLFLMKQAWQRHKIDVELGKRQGQLCIIYFMR